MAAQKFDEYRRNYISARNDQRFTKLYKQQAKIVTKLKMEQTREKMLRKENIVPEKPPAVVYLHQEHSNNKIVSVIENSKHEPPAELDQMRSVIELKRKQLEDITQHYITVSVLVIGFIFQEL